MNADGPSRGAGGNQGRGEDSMVPVAISAEGMDMKAVVAHDPTSRSFNPQKYIREEYHDTSHAELDERVIVLVDNERDATTEALKNLVRDNLGTFIESKDTMDVVFAEDKALFTGEALDGLTDLFEDMQDECEELVGPMMELYHDVQDCKMSKEILSKLYSVLNVPGVLYESCAVRVARRKDAERAGGAGRKRPPGGAEFIDVDGEVDTSDDDSGDNRTTSSVSSSSRLASEADGTQPVHHGRGELEVVAMRRQGGADDYVYDQGEEVFFWYGVPLVRLEDPSMQRLAVEEKADFDGGVLALRRAMLYLEDHYDIVSGTILSSSVEQGPVTTNSTSPSAALAQNGSTITTGESRRGESAVERSTFIFRYCLALFRAALFLNEQLSVEMRWSNAVDTVLIEDTLSMMMDVSVATAKLRYFCCLLHSTLQQRSKQAQALVGLRQELEDEDEVDKPDVTQHLGPSQPSTFASAQGFYTDGIFPGAADSPLSRGRQLQQHPVEYFVEVIRTQSAKMMVRSALSIRQSAMEWRTQFYPKDGTGGRGSALSFFEGTPGFKSSEADGEDKAGGDDGSDDTFALIGDSAQLLGNIADSFAGGSVGIGVLFGEENASQTSATPPNPPTCNGDVDGPDLDASAFFSRQRSLSDALKVGDFSTEATRAVTALSPEVAAQVLAAFRTPESSFETYTTFSIGEIDITTILECSSAQLTLHAKSMLLQMTDRTELASTVMSQRESITTFASRLFDSISQDLEHTLVSYWGGAAMAIHMGTFDFNTQPGSTLATILESPMLLQSPFDCDQHEAGAPHQPPRTRSVEPPAKLPEGEKRSSKNEAPIAPNSSEIPSASMKMVEGVPPIRFIPLLLSSAEDTVADDDKSYSAMSERRNVNPDRVNSSMTSTILGAGQTSNNGRALGLPTSNATLRSLSIESVRKMISTAKDILYALLLAFINRAVLEGFVGTLAAYTDTQLCEERAELHAAILVEIFVSHWETLVTRLCTSVLKMKIVVGETSTATTVKSEAQMKEMSDLLMELERMRTVILRCYAHGIGLLTKAYVCIFPYLELPASISSQGREEGAKKGRGAAAAADAASGTSPLVREAGTSALATPASLVSISAALRPRLSRSVVSSPAPTKLLNLFSVIVDRMVVFLRRGEEVYGGLDLFAAKAETEKGSRGPGEELGDGETDGQRRGTSRSRRAAAALKSAQVDPVTQFLAEYNAHLVMEHIAEHEEVIQTLLANLLLTFVDSLHLKSHRNTLFQMSDCVPESEADTLVAQSHQKELRLREKVIVESLADALSVTAAVGPILVEHLLSPCLFELVISLMPQLSSPQEKYAVLAEKQRVFKEEYLSRVEEHSQIVVEAICGPLQMHSQQRITRDVHEAGFLFPSFDWQRVSAYTTASVRPYIADCLVHIAHAHEILTLLHQPTLGRAVTQRLVGHLAFNFVTAATSDANAFEMSFECSSDFLTHGLTLLEAEALVLLAIVETVSRKRGPGATNGTDGGSSSGPGSREDVAQDLLVAKEALRSFADAVNWQGSLVVEALACQQVANQGRAGRMLGSNAAEPGAAAVRQRNRRRDEMVSSALRNARYMIDAISTHTVDGSIVDVGAKTNSAVTKNLADRLAKRQDGYVVHHRTTTRSSRRSQSSSAVRSRSAKRRPDGTPPVAREGTPSDAVDGPAGDEPRKVFHRRSASTAAAAPDRELGGEDDGFAPRSEGILPPLPAGVNTGGETPGGVAGKSTPQASDVGGPKERVSAVAVTSAVLKAANSEPSTTRRVRRSQAPPGTTEPGETTDTNLSAAAVPRDRPRRTRANRAARAAADGDADADGSAVTRGTGGDREGGERRREDRFRRRSVL